MTVKETYELLLEHPNANIVIFLTNSLYEGTKYISSDFSKSIRNGKKSGSVELILRDWEPKRKASYKYILRFLRKFKKNGTPLKFVHKHLETINYEIIYKEDTNTLYFLLTGQPFQKNLVKPTGEIADALEKLSEKDKNLIYNHGYFPIFRRICGYTGGYSMNEEIKQFFISQAERDVKMMLKSAKRDNIIFKLTHFLWLIMY